MKARYSAVGVAGADGAATGGGALAAAGAFVDFRGVLFFAPCGAAALRS
ncbi:MAG TPA: hypothetical protein VGM06_15865 [Polyangiaceae bacterium]